MAAINDLIQQVEDIGLRERLQQEVDRINKQKKFGLIFEEHLPECTPLYEIPVKKGSAVALKTGKISDTYTVLKLDGNNAVCKKDDTHEDVTFPKDDLVSVAKLGEAIYPYLKPIDSVYNAPDSSLWHTLIEADNYHALQLLEYLYPGKVDCIYIDPPYNTGAKDWKYNNDYVDVNDAYRHSKWLSMMQKRLKLAKKLLNPKDSVLIVTIDEKEYLHLGCLLEEMFADAEIQMVTSVINAKGTVRAGKFSRVEEFIFIVTIGSAHLTPLQYNMLDSTQFDVVDETIPIEWLGLRRRERTSVRRARPNQFYPIFVNLTTGTIQEIGDRIDYDVPKESVAVPDGCIAFWPLKPDGTEMLWGLTPDVARDNFKKGYLRINNWNGKKKTGTIQYLQKGVIQGINEGSIEVIGHNPDGSVIAQYKVGAEKISPKRVWNSPLHNAENYGTSLLKLMLKNREFPFPKSLYAVRDVLKFYISNKKDALILDFFAGSGTTLHAINLLNTEDNGKRRCILVTNNEVSENEAKTLTKKGLNQGDNEWEIHGIAHHVTWPRTVCSIEGHDVNGKPSEGKYLGSDIPMANGFAANAAFFKLGFLDKTSVALGRQFKELIPILWMKAGAIGPCPKLSSKEIPEQLILPENKFAVLIEETCFGKFEMEMKKNPDIEIVYIITDSEAGYREMISHLQVRDTYQLYRDYLDNFRINTMR